MSSKALVSSLAFGATLAWVTILGTGVASSQVFTPPPPAMSISVLGSDVSVTFFAGPDITIEVFPPGSGVPSFSTTMPLLVENEGTDQEFTFLSVDIRSGDRMPAIARRARLGQRA